MISKNNGEYSNCIAAISYAEGNIGYCQMLSGENESACAYSIAKQRAFSNMSDCGTIQNLTMRSACSEHTLQQPCGKLRKRILLLHALEF